MVDEEPKQEEELKEGVLNLGELNQWLRRVNHKLLGIYF